MAWPPVYEELAPHLGTVLDIEAGIRTLPHAWMDAALYTGLLQAAAGDGVGALPALLLADGQHFPVHVLLQQALGVAAPGATREPSQ